MPAKTLTRLFIVVLAVHATLAFPPSVDCKSPPQNGYPFCNTALDIDSRVDDLMSRLSLTEIINQTWSIAPGVERLGIKPYNWRSNCVHGWTDGPYPWPKGTCWTVFPNPMAIGATFDPAAGLNAGIITSTEGRALHNIALQKYNGSSPEASGLNCFSPNVNLYRDPRWGRNMEVFGEDTYHMGHMAMQYTKGLQYDPKVPNYIKIAACTKHYAVHDGPDDIREYFTAVVDNWNLFDTYLPSTEAQVLGAGVAQLMPAYSSLKCPGSPTGPPDCANDYLLKDVLRSRFGAQNISVISDNGGIAMVYQTHKYVPTALLAAAISMNATTDLDLGYDAVYVNNLQSALNEGLVEQSTVTAAVRRSLRLRFQLGDFDPASMVPFQSLGPNDINAPSSIATNNDITRRSIVLLKNINRTLPLSRSGLTKIAVIGPNSNLIPLANYQGLPCVQYSLASALQQYFNHTSTQVTVATGCAGTRCPDEKQFPQALTAAEGADVIVFAMGLDSQIEGEGFDRVAYPCNGVDADVFGLPGCQYSLIQNVLKAMQPSQKAVLVLMHGGGVATPSEAVESKIGAILDTFYGGPLAGPAIVDTLFGDNVPGGHMPITIYNPADPIENMTDYNMTAGLGRTYRFYQGSVLYAFGYGLPFWGSFPSYSGLTLSSTNINACDTIIVSVTVTTTAPDVTGDEVTQVYVSSPKPGDNSFPVPIRALQGFQRYTLSKNTPSKTVSFTIDAWAMSVTNANGDRVILPGTFTVTVGSGQATDPHTPAPQSATFNMHTPGNKPVVVAKSCTQVERKCYSC